MQIMITNCQFRRTIIDYCDVLSFYLSRGESAEGCVSLEDPDGGAGGWRFDWQTRPRALEISGVSKPLSGTVSLLAYVGECYPDVLAPVMLEIACTFAV